MNLANFFVVQYQGGTQGCPFHLPGGLNQERLEWDLYEKNPFDITIKKEYVYTVTDPDIESIEFDLYGSGTKFVSDKFLDMCVELNVKFRAIPLEIVLNGKRISNKKYFLFIPGDYNALMDVLASDFSEELDVESGGVMMNKIFPSHPIYSKINRFVPKFGITSHFFRCIELMDLVCTREFMSKTHEKKLHGIRFVPIDDTYRFDPWADW